MPVNINMNYSHNTFSDEKLPRYDLSAKAGYPVDTDGSYPATVVFTSKNNFTLLSRDRSQHKRIELTTTTAHAF